MQRQTKAYLFALSAVLMWSTVATAFKLSLRHLDPVQLLLYASAVSVLVLGLVLAAQGRFGLVFRFTRRQYLQSLSFGLVNPFVYYLVLFKAYDLLPAQEAQPINYTWAVTLALLSIPLLGHRLSRFDLAATFISYCGVVVISTHGDVLGMHFSDPLGVFLALFSTVIWALYWIYNTRDTRDPVAGLFLNFLFALPFIFLACCLWSSPWPVPVAGLWGAAYVGVFEMGVAFVCWLAALKYTDNASRVGNLIFLSPFLSLFFISAFVGERILPSTFVGLGLIIGGLLVQRLGRRAP